MATIKRRSTILLLIVFSLLILIGSNGLYTMYLTHTIKADAEIINKLGIIRGSIQRLVKHEVQDIISDELIYNIDLRINEFSDNKINVYDTANEIYYSLEELNVSWNALKDAIYTYRRIKSAENKEHLDQLSEEAWIKSNSLVYASQMVSQGKIEKYKNSFFLLAINLLLATIIIYLIKRYVKDTLEYLVNYDGLTKIHNRRFFNEYLNSEIQKAIRFNRALSLIIFDIDHFKRVNDTYGHSVGDNVLKELSLLVQNSIRKCDVLARIGGEEFAIIASDTNIESANTLSEKLRGLVEDHKFLDIGGITISIGFTQFTLGDDSNSIFKRADDALYKAKKNGRNRCESEFHDLSTNKE